jgi:hypothetical protein
MAGAKAMRSTPDQLEDEKNKAQIQQHLRTGTRIFARRLPFVGQIGAARAFPSERGDRRVATEAIKRAMRRGNMDQANEWATWFETRHPGERIGEKAFTAQ